MSYSNIYNSTDTFVKQENLYDILQINKLANKEEIKKAYRKMALKFHPDKNNFQKIKDSKNPDYFIKIKNAYDILSDENLRKEYDKYLYVSQFQFNIEDNRYIFDKLNWENIYKNIIKTTELEKILKIIKKKTINHLDMFKKKDLFNIWDIQNNNINVMTEFLNINYNLDYTIKEIWENKPKIIKYYRETREIFEEQIYPLDLEQIYENEGEQIKICDNIYTGNLNIKINVINNQYNGETYFIFDNELYMIIHNNRIFNKKFYINYLDDQIYKFNMDKLKMIEKKVGNVYLKKNFGLPKLIDNNNIVNFKNLLEVDKNIITVGNLFFMILIY